jgi:hypothetical protein
MSSPAKNPVIKSQTREINPMFFIICYPNLNCVKGVFCNFLRGVKILACNGAYSVTALLNFKGC